MLSTRATDTPRRRERVRTRHTSVDEITQVMTRNGLQDRKWERKGKK